MKLQDLSNIFSGNSLQTKQIIVTKDQEVERRVDIRFSLCKYLKNIGKDEDFGWQFHFGLGYYEVYEKFLIAAGSSFWLIEMAITNVDRYVLLFDRANFARYTKVRIRHDKPYFEYIEASKWSGT